MWRENLKKRDYMINTQLSSDELKFFEKMLEDSLRFEKMLEDTGLYLTMKYYKAGIDIRVQK